MSHRHKLEDAAFVTGSSSTSQVCSPGQGSAWAEDFCVRSSCLAEYVPVIFAENLELASRIKSLLECRGFPTLVEWESNGHLGAGVINRRIPVLVPEEMQDDASEIVARAEMADYDDTDDDDDDDDTEVFDDDDDDDVDEDFEEDDLIDSDDDDVIDDDEDDL